MRRLNPRKQKLLILILKFRQQQRLQRERLVNVRKEKKLPADNNSRHPIRIIQQPVDQEVVDQEVVDQEAAVQVDREVIQEVPAVM